MHVSLCTYVYTVVCLTRVEAYCGGACVSLNSWPEQLLHVHVLINVCVYVHIHAEIQRREARKIFTIHVYTSIGLPVLSLPFVYLVKCV